MTEESVLNPSVCVATMLNNVPVVVTGVHMENVSCQENRGWYNDYSNAR